MSIIRCFTLAIAALAIAPVQAKSAPKAPTAKVERLDCDLSDIRYSFAGEKGWSAEYIYSVGTKFEAQTPYSLYVQGPGFGQRFLIAGSNGLGNTSLIAVDENAEILDDSEDAEPVLLYQFAVNKKGRLELLPNPPQVGDKDLPSMLFLPDLVSVYHYDGVVLQGKSEKIRIAMPRGPMIGKCLETSGPDDR